MEELSDGVKNHEIGKKWYVIGVGGAGIRIVDAMAMRRDQLEKRNDRLAGVWVNGVQESVMLNTNIAETMSTFIIEEVKKWNQSKTIASCMIGGELEGLGEMWKQGQELMKKEVGEGGIEPKLDRASIYSAQGVMLVHSATKGTGCGATPVLAGHIRSNILDRETKPIVSVTVLPSKGELAQGRPNRNGIAGLTLMAKASDAIILFDNSSLDRNKNNTQVAIERKKIEKYNIKYGELNNPLTAFLEGFTVSSTYIKNSGISGDVFDIPDSINPAKEQRPPKSNNQSAVIFAPIYGISTMNKVTESTLETFFTNTLLNGRLVMCDLETATGGSFLFYGPKEKIEQVNSLQEKSSAITDMLRDDKFLNAEEDMTLRIYTTVVPFIDEICFWGLLWEPKIKTLEEMYKHTERYMKRHPDSEEATNLNEIWEDTKAILENLGRKNLRE